MILPGPSNKLILNIIKNHPADMQYGKGYAESIHSYRQLILIWCFLYIANDLKLEKWYCYILSLYFNKFCVPLPPMTTVFIPDHSEDDQSDDNNYFSSRSLSNPRLFLYKRGCSSISWSRWGEGGVSQMITLDKIGGGGKSAKWSHDHGTKMVKMRNH